jgi:hypothetical protein
VISCATLKVVGRRAPPQYAAHVNLDLFAGVRVSDIVAARPWYERLLGSEPAFCTSWKTDPAQGARS